MIDRHYPCGLGFAIKLYFFEGDTFVGAECHDLYRMTTPLLTFDNPFEKYAV